MFYTIYLILWINFATFSRTDVYVKAKENVEHPICSLIITLSYLSIFLLPFFTRNWADHTRRILGNGLPQSRLRPGRASMAVWGGRILDGTAVGWLLGGILWDRVCRLFFMPFVLLLILNLQSVYTTLLY